VITHWHWLIIYIALFAQALILALLLVPLSMRIAVGFGFVAYPGGRHIHAKPMPVLGGMAISGSFLLILFLNIVLAHLMRDRFPQQFVGVASYIANIPSRFPQLGAIVLGALAMSVLGWFDDKKPLGPKIKLLLMVAAALPLPLAGIRIQGFLPFPWLAAIITVVWVVFLTNSFNFLDNMDGLCGGVAAIVTIAFGLISFFAGELFMTAIYAVLAGALLGFLWHNFSPARTFMGDNGSLFIGYMIGALSILSTYYEKGVPTTLPVLTPIIVLGVPLFDTLSVLWIRWRNRKPLMHGDKNHFSHRLVDLGMQPRRAVTFIYVVTAAMALGALPLRSADRLGGIAIFAQMGLIFWIIYRLERTAKRKRERKAMVVPHIEPSAEE